MSTGEQVKQSALAVVRERGWAVFRLTIRHAAHKCDGGTANCKTLDFLGQRWREVSSSDLDEVAAWDWRSVNAYGIDCGKSALVVADQDPGAKWPFPGTRVHSTGRGAHHLYEDVIGGQVRNGAHVRPYGVDVRSEGGLIVGPGSWHPHGAYAVLIDCDPAPVPDALLRPSKAPSRASEAVEPPPLDTLAALDRLAGVYQRMRRVAPGSRNDMLNKLAGVAAGLWVRVPEDLRTGLLSEDTIKAELLACVTDDNDPAKSADTCDRGWDYGVAHPMPDGEVVASGQFFDETPVLRHVRQAAHARLVKAPAVLAALMGYVLLNTDPALMLPPVVGSEASLNLGFALVGASGASKSTSAEVAMELLGVRDDNESVLPIGSGEGMIDAFYESAEVPSTTGGNPRREVRLVPEENRRRMFMVDEGETLKKLADRSGTTLAGFLRTALTGGMLGTTNAKSGGRNRRLPAKTYRLVMIADIHPAQADVLLDGDGVGMPQRFLWMPAADPSLPKSVDDLPEWPGPLGWTAPGSMLDLDYPDNIKREVKQASLDKEHAGADPRLAHANLTRLKVAQALALLHNEDQITDQWWRLAGVLSDLSLRVQDECMSNLSEAAQKKVTARARGEARAVESVEEDRLSRCVESVVRKLQKTPGETQSWRDVKPAHRMAKDIPTEEIVEALGEQQGVLVEVVTGKNGAVAYRLRFDA
ncbi:bifunctional DNA primase/polymerase [Nocardioides sp. Leaf307]|uniref:bifunctional DNA primase/polymerase n=1 Tax=Nocardioides sp. Leaf307 TaxID=1736331 RepID=UPI0007036EE6|nr:bifunctional DNA primase/polymerase [Nocardioides sp. Leaf307]KQQ43085.1 hypothetical protein ASF50_03565 [Nocardioides sp. Leaf307]